MTEIEDDTAAGVVEPAPLADEDYDEPTPYQDRRDRFEALRTEARPPELLLWLDLETSGWVGQPHAETDTVLEAAWAITYRAVPAEFRHRVRRDYLNRGVDLSDWQLTPLRSRLCAIGPGEGSFPHAIVPDECDRWSRTTLTAKVVEMHNASGLTDDHIAAQGAGRIIDHPAILARLIIDDIQAATTQLRTEQGFGEDDRDPCLYIAGDGVGHYDQPLLSRGQFAPLPDFWHYRPEDISHAVHALAPVRHPVQLLLAGDVAQDYGQVLAAGLDVDPRIDLRHGADREVLQSWVDADQVAHRAAADVFRSMMAYLTANHLVRDRLTGHQY